MVPLALGTEVTECVSLQQRCVPVSVAASIHVDSTCDLGTVVRACVLHKSSTGRVAQPIHRRILTRPVTTAGLGFATRPWWLP